MFNIIIMIINLLFFLSLMFLKLLRCILGINILLILFQIILSFIKIIIPIKINFSIISCIDKSLIFLRAKV